MGRIVVFFAVAALLAGTAAVFAGGSPVGSWDCVATTPSGAEMKWTLTLKEQDGKLTGKALSDEGEMPVDDVTYENGTLSFRVSLDTGVYTVTVKFTGDKFDGQWKASSGDASGAVRGVRKA